MADDRQLYARHPGYRGAPSCRRVRHRSRVDRPAVRLDAYDLVAAAPDAQTFGARRKLNA